MNSSIKTTPATMNRIGLLAMVAVLATAAAAQPVRTLKIATLAPEGSPWMNAFEQAKEDLLKETGGRLKLKAYPGGVLGEEKDVLYKMKVGQVDGGGFIGYGISRVCPDAQALMFPLSFRDYEEVDAVLERMTPFLEERSRENGYIMLGWTEVGFSYLYSTQPVRSLKDLQGAKPWSLPNEQVLVDLFKAGGISTIPVPVSDVLTALQTGLIQTIFAPPQAALSMQWHTRVKFRNDLKLVYTFGGVFIAAASWDKLSEDERTAALRVIRKRLKELTAEVRTSNEKALKVMADYGIQTVTSSEQEVKELAAVRDEVLAKFKGSLFSTRAFDLVEQYLREHHAGSGTEKIIE